MIINKEIELYQQVSDKISLQKVWNLLEMTPHSGQSPIIDDFDNDPIANVFTVCLGRRSGKSLSTSLIVIRELLIPFSNTILLTPSYKNSKILFKEVLKFVHELGLPIAEINKGAFTITLENGASFGSFTQSNISSALGSRCSLLVVDETQSVSGVLDILNQELGPMLLDYGVRDSGVLYANIVFLGTPRGKNTEFHTLFERAELPEYKNYRSYQSPSTCNPLLPKEYIEGQKAILSDLVYRQEILAEWVSTGSGVFHAFDQDLNIYNPDEIDLSGCKFINGYDFGLSDSTAMVSAYITNQGDYYVAEAYMANQMPTKKHLENFKAQDLKFKDSKNVGMYGDPSAAQLLLDLASTYNYYISKANNRVAPGLQCLNDLMAPQGMNRKPKLYISSKLTTLIHQISNVEYKNGAGSAGLNGDLFSPPADRSHHWDLIAALRYCIYSHYRQNTAGSVILV